MADEMSPWTPDRAVGKKSKRSRRKYEEQHCVTHFLPENLIISRTYNTTSDTSFSNDGTSSLSGGGDTGMIYLNPQTPNWTLAEKFAELSSGGERRVCAVQDRNPESSQRAEYTKVNKVRSRGCSPDGSVNEALEKNGNDPGWNEQEGSDCPKKLKSHKVRNADSANQRVSKLNQLKVHSRGCSPDGNEALENGIDPLRKDMILFGACEDGKVPRIFAAMKKRSGGIDATEHRPYKCTHCHWAFKKLCNLQSHLDTHTGLKPHVCDICGKAYSHQGTLQQHKRLHTGERPYRCPFCVKTYIWSSDYRKHIRTHTGEKPYVCATCDKDFVRSSDLRKHERNMHTNDKPFPCAHCGKTFNKPLSLQRHERKHLGERPFCCPECGKAFALASRMAEHQKIHRGVRPYVCSVCSKCFTKSSNLLEHEAIHSGVRPHKCAECGVAFAMASRLVRHQYNHSREGPFRCTGCSMNFSHATALKQHQEQRCAGRIFVCTECDKSFQCASKLSQHIMSHKDANV